MSLTTSGIILTKQIVQRTSSTEKVWLQKFLTYGVQNKIIFPFCIWDFEYWSIELQNYLVSWLDPFTLRIIYVLYPRLLEFLKFRVSVKNISIVSDGYPCALKLMNDGSHLFLGNGSSVQLRLSRQFENLKILDAKTL